MSNSKYALAMYDVRGKQEYIFKTFITIMIRKRNQNILVK